MHPLEAIYNHLAQTDNAAADETLRLAVGRAEEPYRSKLVDMVLARGNSAGTAELIRGYHETSPEWQARLADAADALYGGLYQAARSRDEQTRLNCLTIIQTAHYVRLAGLVATLLRDRVRHVRQNAGALLLSWAQTLPAQTGRPAFEAELARLSAGDTQPGQGRTAGHEGSDLQALLRALRRAVADYQVHGQIEAIRAAMILAPAGAEAFWDDQLGGYHAVGRAVRALLLERADPALAGFCISALGHTDLRPTAARALARHSRADYVVAAARELADQDDNAVRLGLKYVREPRWLSDERIEAAPLPLADQLALVELMAGIGGPLDMQLTALANVAREADEPAGLKALSVLTETASKEPVLALTGVTWALESRTETVALAAARELVRLRPPKLRALMVKLLSSDHGRLRAYAGNYLQRIAFASYWANFDRLGPAERAAGGRVVFKLDPQAAQHWRERTRHPSPDERLRAAQVARALGPFDGRATELTRLSGDADRKVRSCAVAALGEIEPRSPAVQRCLWAALADSDGRVRANAIEALAKHDSAETAARLRPYLGDENNRVRANTIRAVMGYQVTAVRQAVAAMLQDSRPAHRRSARWLLSQPGWSSPTGTKPPPGTTKGPNQTVAPEFADENIAVGV